MNGASSTEGWKEMAGTIYRVGSRIILFAVKICDDVFERGDRLLDRGNLPELIVADGADTVLKRDDHLSAALLQLHKRQSMIGWI